MDVTTIVNDTLKAYQHNKRKIEQLRFELENPPKLADNEIIGALALSGNSADRSIISGNHISDKTMMIAMKYHETGEQLVSEAVKQISQELTALEAEIGRIESYVSLLPEKLSEIIRLFYFEGVQNAQIAEQLDISLSSVAYRKNAAVKELVAMYRFLYTIQD